MGAGKSKAKKKNEVAPVKSTASIKSTTATSAAVAPPASASSASDAAASASSAAQAPAAQTAPSPSVATQNAPVKTQPEANKPAEPIDELFSMDPHEIASDLFSIICAHQAVVTEFAVPSASFGSSEHMEALEEAQEKLMASIEPLVNNRKLAQWIRPLHPFQTGMVSSRAASVRGDVENLKGTFGRFLKEAQSDPGMKSALRECHKSLLTNLIYVYGGIEVAFPEYLSSQVDNTSMAVQGCMERALQNDIGQYEIAYRLCITESIKLARISNTKGFQTQNVDVQKELGDSAFTSLRASSVLTTLGRSYMADHSEQSVQNMAQIAKALVGQYQKISELSKIDSTQTDSLFTPETIAAFHLSYDAACKLLADSCSQYENSTEADQTILTICQKLMEHVPSFKETLTTPDTRLFCDAVSSISRLVQLLVIHVSSLLQPDTDAPIYHMCLNGMFASLHYTIQLNLAATCKALYHPVIPPELSALNAIRLMFGTLAIVLMNAIPSLTQGPESPTEDNYDGIDMVTASVAVPNWSIMDVLHYGRPLIVRDEPKIVIAKQEPETVNSILNALEEDLGLEKGPDPLAVKPTTTASTAASSTSTAATSTSAKSGSSSNPLGALPSMTNSTAAKRTTSTAVRPSLTEFSKGNDPNVKKAPEHPELVREQERARAATISKATEPAAAAASTAAPSATSTAPATSAAAGVGPPGAPTPWTTIPADQIDENNLPPGYPDFPPKMGPFEKGGSEEAYKKWMVDRYNREAAENALIVYKRKLKAAQQSVGIN
jgi:hypothetical protein